MVKVAKSLATYSQTNLVQGPMAKYEKNKLFINLFRLNAIEMTLYFGFSIFTKNLLSFVD